ncbi:MAG: ATP synthase F1 subunit gamma [Spirochaetales bacterium]|nr:ATP synthase F1 subunit gamma [Spirochaetales bacterium]
MSNVRDLGSKIQSLENMKKVTRAMNMISSIKLRKHLTNFPFLEEFCGEVENIFQVIAPSLYECQHPVVAGYSETKAEHLIVFTSDKGLCGTHNSSVLKALDAFAEKRASSNVSFDLSCFGVKGNNHAIHSNWNVSFFESMNERTIDKLVLKKLGDDIFRRFLDGEIQKVWVLGKVYKNSLQQDTVLKQILPFKIENSDNSVTTLTTEPEGNKMAEEYGLIYLADTLRGFCEHSFLSEHSARLTAMENATNNSEDMINKYVNMQNHARQAAITNELIEIVSGKEALKG